MRYANSRRLDSEADLDKVAASMRQWGWQRSIAGNWVSERGDPPASCLAELEFRIHLLQQRVCELSVPLRSVMRAHPAPVRMHRRTRPGLLALAFDYGCSTLLFVLLCGAGCGAR